MLCGCTLRKEFLKTHSRKLTGRYLSGSRHQTALPSGNGWELRQRHRDKASKSAHSTTGCTNWPAPEQWQLIFKPTCILWRWQLFAEVLLLLVALNLRPPRQAETFLLHFKCKTNLSKLEGEIFWHCFPSWLSTWVCCIFMHACIHSTNTYKASMMFQDTILGSDISGDQKSLKLNALTVLTLQSHELRACQSWSLSCAEVINSNSSRGQAGSKNAQRW